MSDQYEKSLGLDDKGRPLSYRIVDKIAIPDWLLEALLCEPNKQFIRTQSILDFSHLAILPLVRRVVGRNLRICSSHVHIGTKGLTPHDHLPHAFTSVFYLTDSKGALVVDVEDGQHFIYPKKGRLVFFNAKTVHSVEPSEGELRASLVCNYEYLRV